MKALPLRLEGVFQSWGAAVVGNQRRSLDAPTRSGVIGLCAGALGIDRADSQELDALHHSVQFAVRGDRLGDRMIDFHTALDVPKAKGGFADTVVTRREYLQDASFAVVLVEVAEPQYPLPVIRAALLAPKYLPFLGRKSCVLAVPVHSVKDAILEGANWCGLFDQIPVAPARNERRRLAEHPVWLDATLAEPNEGVPLRQRDRSMASLPRLFAERDLVRTYWSPKSGFAGADLGPTADPFFDGATHEAP